MTGNKRPQTDVRRGFKYEINLVFLMKPIIFAVAMCIYLSTLPAYAADVIPVKKIETVLKSYVNTIGCLVFFDKKDIVKLNDTYIAYYDIDHSCSGGSRMHEPAFAVFKYNDDHQISIIPEQSFPSAQLFGFPQNINRIFIENGELWYEGKEYDGGKDASCCPSIVVKSKILMEKLTILNSKHATDINAHYGYQLGINAWYWIDSRIINSEPNSKSDQNSPESEKPLTPH